MFNIDFDYEDFFVKRLQQLRDQKNISAREMSVSLGQNINYINQIENKKNFPTMPKFLLYLPISKYYSRRIFLY